MSRTQVILQARLYAAIKLASSLKHSAFYLNTLFAAKRSDASLPMSQSSKNNLKPYGRMSIIAI